MSLENRQKLKEIYQQVNIPHEFVDTLEDEKVEYHISIYEAMMALTVNDLAGFFNDLFKEQSESKLEEAVKQMEEESKKERQQTRAEFEKRRQELRSRFRQI